MHYIASESPYQYGVRLTDAQLKCPSTTDITILPTSAWDACTGWNILDLPHNIKGKASETLGRWLIDLPGGWPTSTVLPNSLAQAISSQPVAGRTLWVPGIKAAVAWLFCYLIRFTRYQVWPNNITNKSIGDPSGPPDHR